MILKLLDFEQDFFILDIIDGCWWCPLGNLQCKPSYLSSALLRSWPGDVLRIVSGRGRG